MFRLSRRLLQLTVTRPTRTHNAKSRLSHYVYRHAANLSRPSIKPTVGKKRDTLSDGADRLSGSQWNSSTSTRETASSTDVPIVDQFGLLTAEETHTQPAVHRSLEGRSSYAGGIKPSDSALLDPLEEPELIRRTIRLRDQRPDKRLTWNARQIAIQCAGGDLDAALKAFFDGALDIDRVIPPRYLVHRLLGALAQAGRSADAFHVYKKMKEIGMSPTQATYSRLFRACAEDSAVWYRENEHLFPPSSNGPFLSSFQRRRNQLLEKALCTDQLVSGFGGPALSRAQGLWRKLNSDNVQLSQITANALLLALAKGGDLTGCFQVLDSVLSVAQSAKKTSESAFQPDSYTVTALLSAVRPASLKRHLLAATSPSPLSSSENAPNGQPEPSPMTAFDLSLTIWHRLLPYMSSCVQWGPQCFVSLVHSIGLDFDSSNKTNHKDHMLLFHPKLGLQTIKPTIDVVHRTQQESLTAPDTTDTNSQSANLAVVSSEAKTSNEIQSVLGLDRAVQVFHPDWNDVQLCIQSPTNLLLPMDHAVLIIPPNHGWLPWHRLALIGGLNGFLDCVKQHYNSTITVQLLTALLGLFPTPASSQPTEALDEWERGLIQAANEHKVRLDMGFFNALIDRRTRTGHSGSALLAEAVRLGLVPDQITWGSLARGCKTVGSVKSLLDAFAQASGSEDLRFIRPSQAFLASLLTASRFNWDVKAHVLRLMSDDADEAELEQTKRSGSSNQQQPFFGIEPNRRLIADLEIDIAFFRELLRKGVIPKDGSAVPACPETEGVAIPRYAASAFQRFLPLYRKWLSTSYEGSRL